MNISLQEQEVRIKTYNNDYDSDDTDNHHDRASGWEGCEAWRRDVDDGDNVYTFISYLQMAV